MSLLNNNNNNKKKGNAGKKNQPANPGSKFISKPTKGAGAQKPHKAGGTRGS